MALRFPSVDVLPHAFQDQARRQLAPRSVPEHRRKPRRDDEHNEQVVFFNRIRTLAMNDARYELAVRRTFAIPNGGGRSKREAGRLKAEGVRPGVSDVFCALPVPGRCGLWIEMKSLTGRPSREQVDWLTEGDKLGYEGAVCHGSGEAFSTWKQYVDKTLGPGAA